MSGSVPLDRRRVRDLLEPGTKNAYEISGLIVTQAVFTSIAANLVLVPKTA